LGPVKSGSSNGLFLDVVRSETLTEKVDPLPRSGTPAPGPRCLPRPRPPPPRLVPPARKHPAAISGPVQGGRGRGVFPFTWTVRRKAVRQQPFRPRCLFPRPGFSAPWKWRRGVRITCRPPPPGPPHQPATSAPRDRRPPAPSPEPVGLACAVPRKSLVPGHVTEIAWLEPCQRGGAPSVPDYRPQALYFHCSARVQPPRVRSPAELQQWPVQSTTPWEPCVARSGPGRRNSSSTGMAPLKELIPNSSPAEKHKRVPENH